MCAMAPKTVLIKKYENRRLYDTTTSRYVNLEEVAQILQRGDEVRVVDVATGEDITRLILTQIIVEDAKGPDSNFPLDILRQMVIASGKAGQESAVNYMRAMFDIYQNAYRAISPAGYPFDPSGSASSRPTAKKAPPAGKGRKSAREGRQKDVDGEEGVADLKARVAELEKLVTRFKAKKAPRRK